MKPFEKEQVYDEQIAPLMTQIIDICRREGMPMIASVCYAAGRNPRDPEQAECCTTSLPCDNMPDPFARAINIIRQ